MHIGLLVVAAAVIGQASTTLLPAGNLIASGWGESVNGAKLGIGVASFLRVGQPFDVTVRVEKTTPVLFPTALANGEAPTLEITDSAGDPVPFRPLAPRPDATTGEYRAGIGRRGFLYRIWPTSAHARGRYWKSGCYSIRAVLTVADPAKPCGSKRQLVSNTIRVEIAESDAPTPWSLRDAEQRERMAGWFRDLQSPEQPKRDAAERALEPRALFVLPLIENALRVSSVDALKHMLRLQAAAVKQATAGQSKALLLASLEEETLKILDNLVENGLALRVERARYMPVLRLSEKVLVRLMSDKDPALRIRAIRSLPQTSSEEALKELIARLDDPYYEMEGFLHPAPIYPVALEAQDALAAQGERAIPLLLTLASKPRLAKEWPDSDRWPYRKEVAEIFGKMGHSAAGERFLERMLKFEKDPNIRHCALQALVTWGSASVPLFLRIAANLEDYDPLLSVPIVQHLSEFGDGKEIVHCLERFLQLQTPEALTGAAIPGLARLKHRPVMPVLKRIALSTDSSHFTWRPAVDGFIMLASRNEANEVLVLLMDPQRHYRVRAYAIQSAALGCHHKTVPNILDALDDRHPIVREAADIALRFLVGLPGGVGYDSRTPDGRLWRRWWENNKALVGTH